MQIPFMVEQFLKVFEQYNISVWPKQVILYIMAIVAMLLAIFKSKRSGSE